MENRSIFSSFRRAFRPSSTKVNSTSPRKELSSRVFPEDNERRYEDISDFAMPQPLKQQKRSRKPKHTMSETRKGQERPISSSAARTFTQTAGGIVRNTTKSATLPSSGIRSTNRHVPPLPARIPPPKHTHRSKQPLPLPLSSAPCTPVRHIGPRPPPIPPRLPHAISTMDCSSFSHHYNAQPSSSQHKKAINISSTGPSTLLPGGRTSHEYSEPFDWLITAGDSTNNTYATIPPIVPHRSLNDDEDDDEEFFNPTTSSGMQPHKKMINLNVSASMLDLRTREEYMEISKSTLNLPTVASDYQQPIALRRLPGPPSAVKERKQRREEQKRLRGTILVLDENKTLEI